MSALFGSVAGWMQSVKVRTMHGKKMAPRPIVIRAYTERLFASSRSLPYTHDPCMRPSVPSVRPLAICVVSCDDDDDGGGMMAVAGLSRDV